MSEFKKKNPGVEVDVFAICYNEEFMLPHFIKHYKTEYGAHITIFDNYSTDRSREIASSYGCSVRMHNSGNQIRDDLYLHVKENCWKYSTADWVIACDVDEFLYVDFDISNYTLIRSKGFNILGEPDSWLGLPDEMMNKLIMFRPKKIAAMNYLPGCHACKPTGTVIPSKELAPLLHRKFVSEDYVYERHKVNESRLSNLNKHKGWGTQYMNVTREKIEEQFKQLREHAYNVSWDHEIINVGRS